MPSVTKAKLKVACRSKLLPVGGNVAILKERLAMSQMMWKMIPLLVINSQQFGSKFTYEKLLTS